MPGPMLTVTISNATRQGYIAGPLVVLGHGILETILVLAIGFGLGKLLLINSVTAVIGILGGIILLWMGIGMLRKAKTESENRRIGVPEKKAFVTHSPIRPFTGSVIDGIITSLANPYWLIWWASIGLALITVAWKNGILGLTFFFFGHILSDFVWFTAVSSAIAAGKKIMSDTVYRVVIAICGIILIGFGFYFGIGGIRRLC